MKTPSKRTKTILVSNDDGVHAAGLAALTKSLAKLGRVVVVAPNQQRSASSHSVTLHRPLRINRIAADTYATDGTPTDCIMLGVHEILKQKPDLIVSGINHGANLGDDIHYSGTVSAAFEGGLLGIPSMAVSLVITGGGDFSMAAEFAGRDAFAPAAEFAQKMARKILSESLPKGIILNINVPNIPDCKIKGFAFTKQGRRSYGDIIVQKEDPRGRKYYWIGGDEASYEDLPGTDCSAILHGRISITPLRVNITDLSTLDELVGWRL